MAAMEGRIPQVFKDILGTLLKTGYIYEIPESRIKRREALGLPPLPKANIESLARTFGSMNIKAFLEGEDPSKKIREVKLWA
ncbi:MAG: hypothetical protein QXV74_07185, partial [Candidatus Bathyarchaeia archaeon]